MEATLVQAVVLGAVQGITEFLPVSSTAHLAVIPRMLGWSGPLINSLTFDVALHAGTLVALLAAFRKEWAALALALARPRSRQGPFAWWLAAACLPAVATGLFLEKSAGETFRNPAWIAVFLAAGGALLWWADSRSRGRARAESVVSWRALAIGCAQALSPLPGISRSGITITAGLLLGMGRKEAARYSFLLSTPIILGAVIWKGRHYHEFASANWAVIGAGTAVAALTGMAAIRLLLRFAAKSGYAPYAIYRLVLAAAIAIWALSARLA